MSKTQSRGVLVIVGFVVLLCSASWLGLRYAGIPVPAIRLSWTDHGNESQQIDGDGKAVPYESVHATDSLTGKAQAAQDAIKRGDYAVAGAITSEMWAKSKPEVWLIYPFYNFATAVPDLTDPAFEHRLTAWVNDDRSKPLPSLMRAQYFYDMAWFVRGHGFSHDVGQEAMVSFGRNLRLAYEDISHVLSVDHENAYALYLRVLILRGYGVTPLMEQALQGSLAAYPDFIQPADTFLATLQPKWGGSVDRMYAFVEAMTKSSPLGSPVKLLDLDLYRYLIQVAYDGCWRVEQTSEDLMACVKTSAKAIVKDGVEERAIAALTSFGRKNDYQMNLAVENILSNMLDTRGADAYSGPILLAAANAYSSDTRLQEDPAAGHNYIIDKMVARSWYLKGFNDNALTKYREALVDIGSSIFPSEAEKNEAIADVQETLTKIYSEQKQYDNVILHAKAALEAGGGASNRIDLCYAYFQMGQYKNSIAECTRAILDPNSSTSAFYWLGQSNLELKNYDDAINDLTKVADSQDSRRAGAVIDMSVIYGTRKDVKGSLDVLNKYPYLYDLSVTDKGDVAVAYNNRCYAYMELGELTKALDDCNASLANGSIPDAYKKQQELTRRLAEQK